jgi:hypothetical protein
MNVKGQCKRSDTFLLAASYCSSVRMIITINHNATGGRLGVQFSFYVLNDP